MTVRVNPIVLCRVGIHRWDYRAFRCCSEHLHVERVCRRCGKEDVWIGHTWSLRDRRYWAAENAESEVRSE